MGDTFIHAGIAETQERVLCVINTLGRVRTNVIFSPDCPNYKDTRMQEGQEPGRDLTPATSPGRNSFQEGAESRVWIRTAARSPLTQTLFLDP